ncbi:MAG: bifunctional phosphoribosylaminoimidazolecarboxamide formyltransferase/IMP cyclohydrolase, partial [Pseudomonadota bacterium]
LEELSAQNGATTARFRLRQAARAFARTASYDAAVSLWAAEAAGDPTPLRRALAGRRSETLRYGENPHQGAAFYRDTGQRPGVGTASLVQGKPLSYNNIADTDAAFEAVAEIDPAESAACVIVKHAQPCGAAMGASAADAYARALSADQVSAFGGIVALNTRLDLAAAKAIAEIFTEVIIAPEADPDAIEVFTAKPALRLLLTGSMPDPAAPGLAAKSVTGGLLVQDRDAAAPDPAAFTIATERAPSDAEMADLLFAWRMVKHVRSNAIVLAKDGRTSGIGGGQTNRVDAVRLAATRAEGLGAAKGAAMASDAFFPFADGVEAAAAAGVTSVIQPGGSKRDEEVIAAANAAGMAMVFTHRRHFRH